MIKKFVVYDLSETKKLKEDLSSMQICGFATVHPESSKKVFYKSNLEGCDVSYNGAELTLKFKMKPGQFLALGDAKGVSDKVLIDE